MAIISPNPAAAIPRSGDDPDNTETIHNPKKANEQEVHGAGALGRDFALHFPQARRAGVPAVRQAVGARAAVRGRQHRAGRSAVEARFPTTSHAS